MGSNPTAPAMIKCKYCGKEFDTPQKLGGHIIRCKMNPNYDKNKLNCNNFTKVNNDRKLDTTIYYCKYCGKECKGKNSLTQHEIRCKENPNKIVSNFIKYNESIRNGICKGSNQFIKAKQLGLPIPKVTEETKNKIAQGWLGKHHSQETKEKIKVSIYNNIENNNWHNQFTTPTYYNGNLYDSSWEIEFVKYLERKQITFIRNNYISFDYIWEGNTHKYFPDFYLPEYDLYIEIKGIYSDRDICKWEQFPHKLDIYDSKDLYELGILSKFDKRILVHEKFRIKHIQI